MLWMGPDPAVWKITPVIEVRGRWEQRLDRDFHRADDNRTQYLTRIRAGAQFKLEKQIDAELVFQFGQYDTHLRGNTTRDPRRDVVLGNVAWTTPDGGRLVVGRQRIRLGNSRLFGVSDFSHVSRSFDAVQYQGKRWFAFGGALAVNPSPSREGRVAGAGYHGPFGTTMVAYRSDRRNGPSRQSWTLDHLYQKQFGDFKVDAEVAIQRGVVGARDLRAWAGSLRIGHHFSDRFGGYLEGNVASGGGNSGVTHAFDQIYASNHDHYGILDMQGWRNMQGLSLSFDYKATQDLTLNLQYHRFGLYDAKDAWYGDGGGVNAGRVPFVDPTGRSGKDVGQEISLLANYKLNKHTTLEAAIGTFVPGNFVKRLNGTTRDQRYFYIMANWKF